MSTTKLNPKQRQQQTEEMLSKKVVGAKIRDYIYDNAPQVYEELNKLSIDEIDAFLLTLFVNNNSEPFTYVAIKIASCLEDSESMTEREKLLCGSDILNRAFNAGFYNVNSKSNKDKTYVLNKNYTVPDEIIAMTNLVMFLPPMLVPPKRWDKDNEGGYLTHKTSILLGRDNDQTEQPDYVYAALNKVQKIAFVRAPEYMVPQSDQEFDSIEEAKTTKFLKDKLIGHDVPFYFVWRYDFRGRMYNSGWNLHAQGDEFHKAELNFYNGEMLTEDGVMWLKRAIANAYGLDKETWSKRDKWFMKNIKTLSKGRSKYQTMKKKADEPILFHKLVMTYRDFLKGKPCHTPVEFDATTSFLQIYAIMAKSKELAGMCNISNYRDMDIRMDFYTILMEEMHTRLADNSIPRTPIKKGTMVSYYSAGPDTQRERIEAELGRVLTDFEFQVYLEVKKSLATDAENIMDDMMMLRDTSRTSTCWKTPDGFKVEMKHYVKKIERVQVPNVGRLSLTTYQNIKKKIDRGISPNAVHSLDAVPIRYVIMESDFEVYGIHDGYVCLPNNVTAMMEHYRKALVKLLQEDLMSDMYSQIASKNIHVDLINTLTKEDIMNSNYALS